MCVCSCILRSLRLTNAFEHVSHTYLQVAQRSRIAPVCINQQKTLTDDLWCEQSECAPPTPANQRRLRSLQSKKRAPLTFEHLYPGCVQPSYGQSNVRSVWTKILWRRRPPARPKRAPHSSHSKGRSFLKNYALLARRKKRNSQMRDRIMLAQLRRRFVRLVTLIARVNNFGRRLSMRAQLVARRLQQSAKHLKQNIDNFGQKQPKKCSLTFRHCVHSKRLTCRF